ncbi:MAG: DUF494 domain-containing protein [Methylococcales bacterium]|nr:DUF494 domain-containing protein [Methylococcales bacterium]
MFDVLIYLFENYLDDYIELTPNRSVIKTELLDQGFALSQVDSAFLWLKSLSEPHQRRCQTQAFRIFSTSEKHHLDIECRDLLISLELSGILSPDHREIVIDRTMVLENETITLDELKWIVLLVLLTQSEDDTAYSRMEEIVYDLSPSYLN